MWGESEVTRWRRSLVLLCGLCLWVASGCGGSGGAVRQEKMSRISGVVFMKGKPLDAGVVNLTNPLNGFAASGAIELAGKFSITLVPVGDYRVSISPPMPTEAVDPALLPKPPVDIPTKYQNPTSSGLQVSVPAEGLADVKLELQ